MSCERFRERIIDLAAAEHTDPLLAEHLVACASCREELAARRSVLNEIDRVLADEMREEPSPLLAAQVRQEIDTMEAPRTARVAIWMPIAAAAVLVLALVLMRGPSESPRAVAPVATTGKPLEVPPPPPSPADREAEVPATVRSVKAETRPDSPRRPSTATFPEVIVPEGELEAAVRFSEARMRQPLDVPKRENDRPESDDSLKPVAALTIDKIEIPPIVFKPVEGGALKPANPV